MGKTVIYTMLFFSICFLFAGCSIEKTDPQKIRDLEFAVMEEAQIPEELKSLIEEKRIKEMKMTFDTDNVRYIVIGYGEQQTSGYSISVDELYETSNAVYVNTNLIGPAKGETVNQVKSYPYAVVKIEYIDKSVVFK